VVVALGVALAGVFYLTTRSVPVHAQALVENVCPAAVTGCKGPGGGPTTIKIVEQVSKGPKKALTVAASVVAGACIADGFDSSDAATRAACAGAVNKVVKTLRLDPPDRHFSVRVHARAVGYVPVRMGGGRAALASAVNRTSANDARVEEYWRAGLDSIQKAEGALSAHNVVWTRRQAADAHRFYSLAADIAGRSVSLARAEVQAFQSAGVRFTVSRSVVATFLTRLRSHGWPSRVASELRRRGWSPAELDALRALVLQNMPTAGFAFPDLLAGPTAMTALAGQVQAMRDLAQSALALGAPQPTAPPHSNTPPPSPPDVSKPPTAEFTFKPSNGTVLAGTNTVTFTDRSTDDDPIVKHQWDFGDPLFGASMNTSDVKAPTHAYALPGTYPVTLTVTNTAGQSSSVTHSVTIGLL
jgi:hypothetical protein